jgi:hypothetical protein
VARTILRSDERLRHVVAGIYQDALHRLPDARGYTSWTAKLRSGTTFNDLSAYIYGSPESLQVLGGGDVRTWVNGLYQGLLNRTASSAERDHWAAQAAARGRVWVTWYIAASTEARKLRLNAYYQDLMQRPVDASGLRTWMPLLMQDGDVTVQEFLVTSKEYWSRASSRFP